MSKILEAMKAAAAAEKKFNKVHIKEWGDVYFTPLNGADLAYLQRRHKDFLQNPTMPAMVDLIILKASNEKGEKLFTVEHKEEILRNPLHILVKLSEEMAAVTAVQDAEKNS